MVMNPVLAQDSVDEAPAGPVGYQAAELDWMGITVLLLDHCSADWELDHPAADIVLLA